MARTVDPSRKGAILAEIIDYLLDRPLSGVTFRTLAEGLGVSTYTLVYHFGTKASMVHDIVVAASERQGVVLETVEQETGSIDQHLANVRRSWELTIAPRSIRLLKLEFEAALYQSQETESGAAERSISRTMFDRWNVAGVESLMRMGIEQSAAEEEIRLVVDTLYGLQFDLIITGQVERASAAFELSLAAYERRLRELIPERISG
jgi:AcrR family transcriptional regulator